MTFESFNILLMKGAPQHRARSGEASRRWEWDTELKRSRTRALILGVSSAGDGVTSRTNVPANSHLATALVITGQLTTSETWWDAWQSSDHSVVIRWKSAPTAEEIALPSATDAWRRPKPQERHGRVGRYGEQYGHPRMQPLM